MIIDKKKRTIYFGIALLVIAAALAIFSKIILIQIGEFLVMDEKPVCSDAIVVLSTGVEYYPRLIEAASLLRKGVAKRIMVNGNRKTDVLRGLEEKGFKRCCPWYENILRIFSLLGVLENQVLCISAEDAFDTVSEAEIVGKEVLGRGFTRIILTTSKFHTRRARFIWTRMFGEKLSICVVAAKMDPYDPKGWWKEGRQIRWVLAEYGAWVYYWWKN